MSVRLAVTLLVLLSLQSFAVAAQVEPAPSIAAQAQEVDETTPVPIPVPTRKALEFRRTGDMIWAFARVWDMAVPFGLLISGASVRLRNVAQRIGKHWLLTVGIYLVLFLAVVFILDLPLRYYAGYIRLHEYGLSRQTFSKWFGDSVISLVMDILGAFFFGWIPFYLIRRLPRAWWLVTGLLMVPFLAFIMLISPVLIDPLYNEFRPMSEMKSGTTWARPGGSEFDRRVLETKILALAARADIPAKQVFVVEKSIDTVAVNAYVTGLFGTHRVVLWDTMLAKLDDREILAIMGHEMGHYVLGHVPWTITMSSLVVLAGLFFTDRVGRRVLARYSGRLGFDSLSDVAATPLLLILIGVSSTALSPLALAYRRYHEHEADRFSLELTHMNRSSARAFADLQRENLGVPHQTWIYRLWRATHPSIAERITFCNEYRPWTSKTALPLPPSDIR